ncbi:MAG: CopG family transcriptional regulator [Clostridia bacterium]|nr:CopG family transcriptional regulator [Clostridia bacterium]
MGRPIKSGERKDISLHLRITPSEAERIKECSEKMGLNRTDTIMQGITLLEQTIGQKTEK